MAESAFFSTLSLPGTIRFTTWRDRLRRIIGDVSVSTPVHENFVAWSRWIADGGVSLFQINVAAQCIERAEQRACSNGNLVHIVFPLTGEFHMEQGGRKFVLDPGSWGLYDPTLSFRSDSNRAVEFLVLAAPRSTVLGRQIRFESCSMQRFSAEAGGARIAKGFLSSLLAEGAALSPVLSTELTSVAAQLIRLSLLEGLRQDAEPQVRELLRARIQAYVERNLHDPDLGVAAIANEHDCSKRYIHKIFSTDGETISEYILRTRLERCWRDLANPALAHVSITDIAFSWGFNSQGHFSHAFRKHFGVSPSECRQAAGSP